MPILFFAETLTPRIQYAAKLLLAEVLGADEVVFTTSFIEAESTDFTKIYYHNQVGGVHVVPHKLLFEDDIQQQNVQVENHNGVPQFFSTTGGCLGFDVFAASFFLVSRYEEYLPFVPDVHQRFSADQSLAFAHHFLEIPLVNIWAMWLKDEILKKYPQQKFTPKPYNFIPTVDVDNCYAYRGKGLKRTIGAAFQDIMKLNFKNLAARLSVILGFQNDPFNTFETQIANYNNYNLNAIYFMLCAKFGSNDRNVDMHSPAMKTVLQQLQKSLRVAIHPSYKSNSNVAILQEEIENLGQLLGEKVTQSRQHYLKMSLPKTYRNLAQLGITADYSMGYASHPGFRASIATPFTFYDLQSEQTLPLTVHPFMIMDVTFFDYQQKNPEQAWPEIVKLVDTVRAVDGQFISVFHNRVLSGSQPEWENWPQLYVKLLAYAKP